MSVATATTTATVTPATPVAVSIREDITPVEAPPPEDPSAGNWPDDSAESAFLAEARERGEPIAPAKAKEEIAEETDSKSLPSLNSLVERIPAEVRDVLEDLFRARFVTVKRVPKRALKS